MVFLATLSMMTWYFEIFNNRNEILASFSIDLYTKMWTSSLKKWSNPQKRKNRVFQALEAKQIRGGFF